jgi:hypothetical protein
MPAFRIRYTGDSLDETGAVGVGDIALDLYDGVPFADIDVLRDQAPAPGDARYRDPAHVAAACCAPRRATFPTTSTAPRCWTALRKKRPSRRGAAVSPSRF